MSSSSTLGYLARRGVSSQWRIFLRALIETVDANLPREDRDRLLRVVGERMASLLPLPACESLAELQARMNDQLAAIDWGYVEITLPAGETGVILRHAAVPVVAVRGDEEGLWAGAVLEGLYGAWLGAQPGAEAGVPCLRLPAQGEGIVLRYGR